MCHSSQGWTRNILLSGAKLFCSFPLFWCSCMGDKPYVTMKQRGTSGSDWPIFFTNTQINMIGSFDWKYRGGGDICHLTSWDKICLSIPGKEIVCKILHFAPHFVLYSFRIPPCSTWIMFLRVTSKKFWPRYSRSVFQRLAESCKITEQNSNSAGLKPFGSRSFH